MDNTTLSAKKRLTKAREEHAAARAKADAAFEKYVTVYTQFTRNEATIDDVRKTHEDFLVIAKASDVAFRAYFDLMQGRF